MNPEDNQQPVQNPSLVSRIIPDSVSPRTKKIILFSLGILFLIFIILIPAVFQNTNSTPTEVGSVKDNKAASDEQLTSLDQKYKNVTKSANASQYTINARILSYQTKENITTFSLDLTKGVIIDSKTPVLLQTNQNQLPPTSELPVDATLQVNCGSGGMLSGGKNCVLEKITLLTKPQKELSYLEVAKTLNQWISAQKNAKGLYAYGELCDGQGICKTLTIDNRVGLAVIYANYQLYRAEPTANTAKTLINTINKDLLTYQNLVMQNDYLNCSWMYELITDPILSTDSKNAAINTCWHSTYPRPHTATVGDPDAFIAATMPTIFTDKTETLPFSSELQGDQEVEIAGAYATDFAARSLWQTTNPVDTTPIVFNSLQSAKQRFAEGLSIYSQQKNLLFHPDVCTLGTGALGMYQATQNASYLTFAQQLAEKINFGDECSSDVSASQCGAYLRQATLCADFLHRLYRVTQNVDYRDGRNKILDYLIATKWDQADYAGVITNSHAFYHIGASKNIKYANTSRSLQENAILMNLFAQIKKKEN